MNTSASSAGLKLGVNRVKADAHTLPRRFAADAAQRLQQFEQANVFMSSALHDWQRVSGDGSVDGELLFLGGSGRR